MASTRIGQRAVVIGAGMAGLPAARSLADFFEEVVVLERDALAPSAACVSGRRRRGIPMRSSMAVSARSASFFPAL